MSRKKELDTISSFLGNAAAHAGLLPESVSARKEVVLYSSEAHEIFMAKYWNEEELAYLKKKSMRRATSEIKGRIIRYNFRETVESRFISLAENFIDHFLNQAKR